MKVKFPFFVITKLSVVFQRIQHCIQGQKHIEIKHHFIRDHVQNGTMDLQFVPIDDQLANIFTKPLVEEKLILLRNQLGMVFINE